MPCCCIFGIVTLGHSCHSRGPSASRALAFLAGSRVLLLNPPQHVQHGQPGQHKKQCLRLAGSTRYEGEKHPKQAQRRKPCLRDPHCQSPCIGEAQQERLYLVYTGKKQLSQKIETQAIGSISVFANCLSGQARAVLDT